ncbi:hypothetical protein [Microbaculum marinum]|uniref:DUF222 domain-containing protein n=1 Tax=Microbaculum marinum TaxID=1764581 RepID=A0AAW9RW39_9HYPH
MSNQIHDLTPVYGEAAYLDDDEMELIRRTRGHRLAVLPDRELPGLVRALSDRCMKIRGRLKGEGGAAPQTDTLATALASKLDILSAGVRRAAAEGERRNMPLDSADLNAFAEDLLGVDLDRAPHRRGSAAKFARTMATPRVRERILRTPAPGHERCQP